MRRIVSCLILVSSASAYATSYAMPDRDTLKVLHVPEAIALMQAYLDEHPDSADAWLHLGSIHANAYARGMDAVEIVHYPAGDQPPAPQNMGIPPMTVARRLDSVSEPRLTHLAHAVRAFQQVIEHAAASNKEQALVGLGYALYECHDRFEKVPWPLDGEPFDGGAKEHGAEPQWWKEQALAVFRQIEIPEYANEEEMWRGYESGGAKSVATLYIVQILQDRSSRTDEQEKELAKYKKSADQLLESNWMYLPFKPALPPQPREIEAIYPVTPAGLATAELYLRAIDALFSEHYSFINLPWLGISSYGEYQAKPVSPSMLKDIGSYLACHAETLRFMREAAQRRECRYPIDMNKGVDVELPFGPWIRQLIRVQALRVLHAAENGDSATVTMALSESMALTNSLRHEPHPISQRVRIAMIEVLLDALQDAQNRMALDIKDLRALQEGLFTLEGTDGLVAMLRGESFCMQMELSKRVEPPTLPDSVHVSPEERYELLRTMREVASVHPKPEVAKSLYMSMLAAATLPVPEAREELVFPYSERETFLRSVRQFLLDFYRCHARLRAAQIALAVDRYSQTNSRPPESLNDLMPEYIREMPLNPFTDEPMRYELLDGGFKVYSVPGHKMDDNGVLNKEANPNQPPVRMAVVLYNVGGVREAEQGEGVAAN